MDEVSVRRRGWLLEAEAFLFFGPGPQSPSKSAENGGLGPLPV